VWQIKNKVHFYSQKKKSQSSYSYPAIIESSQKKNPITIKMPTKKKYAKTHACDSILKA
jgi:hypothetical protein